MRRLLPILALAACSYTSTQVTDVFRDPAATRFSFQRVATIAIVKDPAIRRQVEDEMARQLGTKGVAGYTVLSDEDLRSAASIRSKLQTIGIDGVVTMELLSRGEEPIDPKGEIPDSYKSFAGHYGAGRGAVDWEDVARIETQIFSVPEDKLLWSAATKTFQPSNAKETVAAVSRAIAKELKKSNLLP